MAFWQQHVAPFGAPRRTACGTMQSDLWSPTCLLYIVALNVDARGTACMRMYTVTLRLQSVGQWDARVLMLR